MLVFYNLFYLKMAQKREINLAQKKWIIFVVIGLIFVSIFIIIKSPETLSTGITCIIIGIMQYLIKGRQNNISDEMTKKVQVLAMANTFQIALTTAAIIYLLHSWRFPNFLSINTILGSYIFWSLALYMIFQRYRGKNIEKIPF